MTELETIKNFLSAKKIAIAGASRDPKKFGHSILKELSDKGYEVYPVNPEADEIAGFKCYRKLTDLPDDVAHLHIVTNKSRSAEIVQQAVNRGIQNIWLQLSSDSPEAIELIKKHKLDGISKRCILMYAEPVKGFHNFHRFLNKFFGTYAK